MSNPLSVRRVKFQDLNSDGSPDGEATFGVIASDNESMEVVNTFQSLEELEVAIGRTGCILDIVDPDDAIWPDADRIKIGTDNYYGKDWDRDAIDPEVDKIMDDFVERDEEGE